MTDHWAQAVEAMTNVDRDCDGIPIDGPEAPLHAAAPHLERHFREEMAEELRQEAETFVAKYPEWAATVEAEKNVLRWAADHLTRKEVME